jgi:NTP pyrophosphatase (non-canonical NTP hydrolase)
MNNNDTTIAQLTKIVQDFRVARGWDKFDDPYDIAAALSVEAAEILELLLWKKNGDNKALIAAEPNLKERLSDEIADVFAYTLVLAHTNNIDLTQAFIDKMKKNAEKRPVTGSQLELRKRWLE